MLERNVGKRVADRSRDSYDQIKHAIKLVLQPLGKDWQVTQETLNTDREWREFTLPSMKALNLTFHDLRGKFVKIERTPIGSTYTNKKTGEVKEKTAIQFIAVYPDRDTCQQAADAFFKKENNGNEHTDAPQASASQPATDQAEREFAKSALSMLWQASGQNKDQFLSMLKSNPMIAKYFNETSDEVQAILSPELAA